MSHIFNKIIEGGYWVAFGSLSPQQRGCKDYTAEAIDEIFAVRQREKYVNEIKACICGYPPADETEPMVPENFSQYQFYLPIEREIVDYVDRFDYLICCVANGICKVHKGFEERYERALLTVLTFRTAIIPAAPLRVLDEELMKAPAPVYGEQNRSPQRREEELASYLAKADPYSKSIKEELARLEAEEMAAEHRRIEAMDRAAGHNPYKVTPEEAGQVADEMTQADVDAVKEAARYSSAMAQGGIVVVKPTGTTSSSAQDASSSNAAGARRVTLSLEDPTPTLSLVLAVKAEEEARKELERRRNERRLKLLAEEAAVKKAKAEAEEAKLKEEEDEIVRLQRERLQYERKAAEAAKALEEATKIRDAERAKMAAQLARDAAYADQKRLEEAAERERVARIEAEKTAKRQQEAAEREAIAREAGAREARRQQLEAARELQQQEEARRLVAESAAEKKMVDPDGNGPSEAEL